jgi:SAM-dependent methyltransferase
LTPWIDGFDLSVRCDHLDTLGGDMNENLLRPSTTDGVLALLDASFVSAALGAAFESGLFRVLDERPMDGAELARILEIPPLRCAYWLRLLEETGLLDRDPGGYRVSDMARRTILQAFSLESWGLLAEEARGRLPGLCDLPRRLRGSRPAQPEQWSADPKMYMKMASEPETARRFTRMLFELHRPLADHLAEWLDLTGVERLMDLGGGSGVISLALARRWPSLRVVVVDMATVCEAGREIAARLFQGDRVHYYPADFYRDDLPAEMDMVLECDVNLYDADLLRKVWASLRPGGRFVIVDQFAPAEGVAPAGRAHWALENALADARFTFPTVQGVRHLLCTTGFRIRAEQSLKVAGTPCSRFTEEMTLMEAEKIDRP